MTIFLNVLFLVVGMALLIKGADFFVSGASDVAKRLKVPSIFIGLTIVALGTSLPELSVSITSAIAGNVDMSAGNIVGSNMFNMLVVLGLVALFKPVALNKSTNKIDFPFLIAITGVLTLFGLDSLLDGASSNMLSRTESILLMVLLVLYISILIFNANRTRKRKIKQEAYIRTLKGEEMIVSPAEEKGLKIWQTIIYIILGLLVIALYLINKKTELSYLTAGFGTFTSIANIISIEG